MPNLARQSQAERSQRGRWEGWGGKERVRMADEK